MSEKLNCPICGEPTRVYMGHARKDGLCGKHADMLKAGELTIDENGNYKIEKENNVCCICGKESDGKEVCKNCYKEIMNQYKELDKNQNSRELADYYYNLKNNIERMQVYNYVVNNIYKLFSIAWANKNLYRQAQLSERVANDAKNILEKKKSLKEQKITAKKQQDDKVIESSMNLVNRADDGHVCDSKAEAEIDNILYEYHICHAIHMPVKEILERVVLSDWYIPLGGTKGIYIEYWGMEGNKEYEKNKEEKIELYKKNSLKLIQIYKNDIDDKLNLKRELYRQLRENGWKDSEN